MEGLKYNDIDYIIERVKNENVEIELEITPDRQTLTVRPFKAFEYACPYRGASDGNK